MVAGGTGTVLASYGRGALVQSGHETVRCGLVGRKLRIVCGDSVVWGTRAAADWPSVESVAPRRNLIERIDARGRAEPVAANIDRVAIVAAVEPKPDWFIVDRYWAGALLKEVEAVLIVNKSDLGHTALRAEIDNYRRLGITCIETAARRQLGLELLVSTIAASVSLLVGQSGVGKSSLVNALIPDAAAQTAELTRDAEGRHTTTTARWYQFGAGGAIIDAPGVRDFAAPASVSQAAERGFVEIRALSTQCRFSDCRHLEEPACAVREATERGAITARRYESYRRLYRLYEKFAASSH
jgi:ribosome biogenesis GTPase